MSMAQTVGPIALELRTRRAESYIKRMRNRSKREFANRVLDWLLSEPRQMSKAPRSSEISVMAQQMAFHALGGIIDRGEEGW